MLDENPLLLRLLDGVRLDSRLAYDVGGESCQGTGPYPIILHTSDYTDYTDEYTDYTDFR